MLLAGDELGRSQRGNNNTYAQDNELSWVNWGLSDTNHDLQEFVRRVVSLRQSQPLFHRASWRDGMTITWLNPGGGEQRESQWADSGATTIGVRLCREDLKGQENAWWEALVLFNPHSGPVSFALPERAAPAGLSVQLDTSAPDDRVGEPVPAPNPLVLEPRSLVVLA